MTKQHKTVLITGSTKGMGYAIANKFASESYDLVLIARSDKDLQEQKKSLLEKYKINVHCMSADLSDKKQINKIIDNLEDLKLLPDVLVNNIGVFQLSTILEEEENTMEKIMNINFYPGYYLTKLLLPKMLKRDSGHIFSICSFANIQPVKEAFAYTVSKYAVYGFIKTLRETLIDTNVKTTAIIPGSTLTSSWEGTSINEERFILAEDIAETIYVASNLSKGACMEEVIIRPQHGQV